MNSRTHEQFATLLARCSVLWKARLDDRLRPWGMTHASWRILHTLAVSNQQFHQTSLAKEIGVETPTLVGLLDRMERMQWVRREPDPHDRRAKIVEPTAQGAAICKKLESEVEAVRQEMLAALSKEEVRAGIALFEKMLKGASST